MAVQQVRPIIASPDRVAFRMRRLIRIRTTQPAWCPFRWKAHPLARGKKGKSPCVYGDLRCDLNPAESRSIGEADEVGPWGCKWGRHDEVTGSRPSKTPPSGAGSVLVSPFPQSGTSPQCAHTNNHVLTRCDVL